jgi:SAM-dependent methyltransferase
MADAQFEHPRLAAIYDALDGERSDLEPYVLIAEEVAASRVLDVGCGTGTFALMLAARGLDVIGLEPAAASLKVARGKDGAERVHWVHGDAGSLRGVQVDLATMTANVAQAIADPREWDATLAAIRAALRPGGYLVFETRDPACRAWEDWTKSRSRRVVEVDGIGAVETWLVLDVVALPIVSFRSIFIFHSDGAVLTSESTLRFRDRAEIEAQLASHRYVLEHVRDAPDRPGRELVFIARRP